MQRSTVDLCSNRWDECSRLAELVDSLDRPVDCKLVSELVQSMPAAELERMVARAAEH